MIYFIVDNSIYKGNLSLIKDNRLEILKPNKGISNLLSFIGKENLIGFDIETSGLDPYTSKVIFWTFGNNHTQFVVHSSVDVKKVLRSLENKQLLGQNLKFDIKFAWSNYKVWLRNLWDTMIAEQCIYQKSGMSMALNALVDRYLKKPMLKAVREEFHLANPNTFQVLDRHVIYAANDVIDIFPIKEKQEELIHKYKLNLKVYDIEFPLISIIAKAELTGFRLDEKKWKENYNKQVKRRFELEVLLDKEVRRLRDESPKEIRVLLSGGKYDNPRHKDDGLFNYDDGSTNVLDLFGEPMSTKTLTGKKKKVVRAPNNINYNSPDQRIEIFAKLKESILDENDNISVPKLIKKERKVGYQTNSDAFNAYLKMRPNCRTKQLIEYLIEYGSVSNMIKNFGLSFINKINPVTGNIHTIYRQMNADTGRFQSGGGKKEQDKPNFQNIPAEKDYRNCFLAREGCSITTTDYSGAELMVMVSVSGDKNLLELSRQDMHSHMNQAIWRNIYKDRYNKLIKLTMSTKVKVTDDVNKQIESYKEKANNFVICKEKGKEQNVEFRNKNLTFGSIYGMYAAKAGKTMNVSKEEGAIAISTIKKIIPKIFQAVEAASKFVEKNGYIIINSRTNSRAWFPQHIKLFRGEISKDDSFKLLQDELSEARNIKIQGTQADFVKEATVVLQQYIDHYNLDVIILHWVHDEIVTDQPKYIDGKSAEWKQWIKENPKGLSIIYKGKKLEGLSFVDVKQLIMKTVANRYLRDVEIETEYETLDYWTK